MPYHSDQEAKGDPKNKQLRDELKIVFEVYNTFPVSKACIVKNVRTYFTFLIEIASL